jgi:hypothetical protein
MTTLLLLLLLLLGWTWTTHIAARRRCARTVRGVAPDAVAGAHVEKILLFHLQVPSLIQNVTIPKMRAGMML